MNIHANLHPIPIIILINFHFVHRLKKLLVRSTSVGSAISYFHKQTEQTLIRQLLQRLPDLGLLYLGKPDLGLLYLGKR